MPLQDTLYRPPAFFRNGHLSTIYSGLFRRVKGVVQKRERILLPDGDFLDLDWSFSSSSTQKVVILLHGLEGDAQRHYILGSAKLLNHNGFDACAVNMRSCSGEQNHLYRSYHSGATEDVTAVIHHILESKDYSAIYIKGYSLGGNLTLKYLGEGNTVPTQVKAAIAVSVPCDLASACIELLKPKNRRYANRFKKHLVAKLKQKQQLFPDKISFSEITSIKTLKDFDDVYTSCAHGFKDADDYYKQCSSLQFLGNIQVPSLIINAQNDSFLGESCYPLEEADKNKNLYLETPRYGGHVGFWGKKNVTYPEIRAFDFFKEIG